MSELRRSGTHVGAAESAVSLGRLDAFASSYIERLWE